MNQSVKMILIVAFLLLTSVLFTQNKKENFIGRWKAPRGTIIIITILGDAFIGKTEKENVIVLKDVRFSEGKWFAVILNPQENIIAPCELIVYPTKLKIIASRGIFHKTLYWIKL